MNTYDDEATKFDGENNYNSEPQPENIEIEQEASTAEEENAAENPEPKKRTGKWMNQGIGAVTGVLLGGASTFLMGMRPKIDDHKVESVEEKQPAWSDGKIPVATSVNDNMSFGEAFAAARTEVGPGGAFEWHGNVYATYTAEEWNSMTPQQREDFGDHFSWNHVNKEGSNGEHHSQTTQPHDDVTSDSSTDASNTGSNTDSNTGSNTGSNVHTGTTVAGSEGSDDIEVVSVNHTGNPAAVEPVAQNPADAPGHGPAEGNPEIEVLGVMHDSEANANIAGLTIDGQDVIVIDVDNDMTFDVLAADINGNGTLENEEVFDIHDQNLTVADLGGLSDASLTGNMAPDQQSDLADSGVDYTEDGGFVG